MKKFTKLMLTLAMLIVGVEVVNAEKLYADFSKLGNGPVSTWNGDTNTMTWTGTSNNMISNFSFPAGNYRAYSTISITVSDLSNAVGIRLQIKANGQEKLVALNGNGTFTKYLTDDFGFAASDLTKVEWIRVLGSAWQNGENNTIDADHPASAVISDVYLNGPTRTLDVNLGKMAASEGNATWDLSSNTFAWTGTWSNAITLPGLSGNLSSFTKINYETTAGTCDHFRILIYYSNGASQTTYYTNAGNKSVTFEEMGVSVDNLAHVDAIKISGASDATGNITLNSFSLEGPLVIYLEKTTVQVIPEGAKDINGMTGSGNIKWNVSYPQTLTTGTGWCGNIDGDDKSIDISAYDYLHFDVTDASNDANLGLRVFVWDGSNRHCLYPHPIDEADNVTNWETFSPITSTGIYVVKISDYPLLRGFKTGNSWEDGNAGTITVSLAYVISGSPAAPSEITIDAGADALNDANATCFDVTCLPGTSINYTAANPNALFIAKEGQLTNTKNVIVGSTCANLELTDGHSFKAPKNFKATSAKFTKTVGDAKYATMVLPFAVETLPSGVEAFNITGNNGDVLTTTTAETIEANKPVMLKNAGNYNFTASNVEIAATTDDVQNNGLLYGAYSAKAVPTANTYVLQKQGDDVNFYKAIDGLTVNPFRAYLTASAGARLTFDFNETNGIKSVETTADNRIYNIQGVRVDNPTKGLYIVNGKKAIVK